MKYRELALVLGLAAFCLADDLTLSISEGQVKGTKKWTYAGNSYYAFYSIRYAKPPTGSLRFQAPVAVDPWSDVYDATTEGNICYQVNVDSADESEDCLSLSVYTPKNPSELSSKLPVLFNIHGGGFNWGSGQTKGSTGGLDPGYFMDTQKVIVVSINYRLGPFGFFSTGDTVIPGNAGLKDQRLALKWVQKNIANFGGDPSKVTIFGESAGGASVGYQILSKSSQGLFRGGILSSGTALCPWAYQRNQTEITFKTASFINSEFNYNRDSATLFNYLQNVDAKLIDTASKSYSDWAQSYSDTGLNGVINGQLQQGFFYAPVVEVETADAFLTEKPYQILESGNFNQVPILIGTCADEGLMSYNQYTQWTLSIYDQDNTILVPQGMHIQDQATKMVVGNAIKSQYSPYSDLQYNILAGIQYFSEQDFQKSLIRHAEMQSKYADVYFYKFSYSGQMGGNTNTYPGTSNVTHTEEMGYIWQRGSASSYPQADQNVHQRFMQIWTNFVIYQNPTPTQEAVLQNIVWQKLTENNLQYVDIGADLALSQNPIERYAFWKHLILTKYGVPPYETF
ncbi:esterase FE4-like [Anthonomus grandis grandis]|uniref:esterase FE4-like n=1 Tax=Anthonomus grandis grandis TaxID=2921223 RepID=UPI002165BA71|nr:esterase FE4-like [Anthonomus grandis grandis]